MSIAFSNTDGGYALISGVGPLSGDYKVEIEFKTLTPRVDGVFIQINSDTWIGNIVGNLIQADGSGVDRLNYGTGADGTVYKLALERVGTTYNAYSSDVLTDTVGGVGTGAVTPTQVMNFNTSFRSEIELYSIKIWNSSATLIHHFDPNAADTGATGSQPVVPDIVGAGTLTGVGMLTDASVWVTYGDTGQNISPPLISSTATVFNPVVELAGGTQTILPPLIDNPVTVFNPTVTGGAGYDVIVIAGQSNAVGQPSIVGGIDDVYTGIGGTKQFGADAQTILDATNPLDHFSTGGMGFWLEMVNQLVAANHYTRPILLVPVALNGTGFSNNYWNPGNWLFNDAVSSINAAMATGGGNTLKAFLWFQGESDANVDSLTYESDLNAMRTAMISQISGLTNETNWICAKIKGSSSPTGVPIINAALESFTNSIPNGYLVETTDQTLYDQYHFDQPSLRTIGQRFATGIQYLDAETQNIAPSLISNPVTVFSPTVVREPVAPILPATLSLTGYVDQSYQRQLTTSGDAATSWTITGGADAANYTISNSGLLQRIAPNDTEESEVITVTATNAAGTSGVMTITVNYIELTQEIKKITFEKLTGVKLTATKPKAEKL